MLRAVIVLVALVVMSGSAGIAATSDSDDGSASQAHAAERNLGEATRLLQDSDFQRAISVERERARALRLPGPEDRPSVLGIVGAPADRGPPVDRDVAARRWSDRSDRPPLVLVSFSMPPSELKALLADAARIDAVMVLRGLVKDSMIETQAALAALAGVSDAAVRIDPTLFARFRVERVPTFILPLEPLLPCGRSDCPVPLHVRVEGSGGLAPVLERIRQNTPYERARATAAQLLERLRRRS